MRVFIRCDSSFVIGSGHVMRCLTLADILRDLGAHVNFICAELPGNLCSYIEKKGFCVYKLFFSEIVGLRAPGENQEKKILHSREDDAGKTLEIVKRNGGAELLIVDHYALDIDWERQVRQAAAKIMVIDDLADRVHDCDMLLDQNYYLNMHSRYDGLLPDHCLELLGPDYSLLRNEFYEVRKNLRKRDGLVKRVLVFFGGSDPDNQTVKALKAISLANRPDIAVDVVVGGNNPNREIIRDLCGKSANISFHCQVENMAELMSAADLSIGAGGTAMVERCFLGLPSIVIILADNQYQAARDVAATGAILLAGWHSNVDVRRLYNIYQGILADSVALKEMENKAINLIRDKNYDYIGKIIMNIETR